MEPPPEDLARFETLLAQTPDMVHRAGAYHGDDRRSPYELHAVSRSLGQQIVCAAQLATDLVPLASSSLPGVRDFERR